VKLKTGEFIPQLAITALPTETIHVYIGQTPKQGKHASYPFWGGSSPFINFQMSEVVWLQCIVSQVV